MIIRLYNTIKDFEDFYNTREDFYNTWTKLLVTYMFQSFRHAGSG